MYERRGYVQGDSFPERENHEDTTLAVAYRELQSMYKVYQQVVLTMDRRYIPQAWTDAQGDTQYAFDHDPSIDHEFVERRATINAQRAQLANDEATYGESKARKQRRIQLDDQDAVLTHQEANLQDHLVARWKAFDRLCKAISENEYVKQFYNPPTFLDIAERIDIDVPIGERRFFPTQESRLTQYQLKDNFVYYKGIRYNLDEGSTWNSKQQEIYRKLLSFENPFP